MNTPAKKLTNEERKAQVLETQIANEAIHSLVVKIISWKTGAPESHAIQNSNKITPAEWQKYKKHLLSISKIESAEDVRKKLDAIYEAIKSRGGFE